MKKKIFTTQFFGVKIAKGILFGVDNTLHLFTLL